MDMLSFSFAYTLSIQGGIFLQWINKKAEELFAHFAVSPTMGLTSKQADKLLLTIGPNKILEADKVSYFRLFIEQFNNFMVLILMVAMLISFFLGDYVDSIAIIGILLSNAI